MWYIDFLANLGGIGLVLADIPPGFSERGVDDLSASGRLVEAEDIRGLIAGGQGLLPGLQFRDRALCLPSLCPCCFEFGQKLLHLNFLSSDFLQVGFFIAGVIAMPVSLGGSM